MQLIPFQASDYPRLIRWIDSPEANQLWGGPCFDYPLTQAQLAQHYAKAGAYPYLFHLDDEVVGFAELQRAGDASFRICRVWIDPAARGKGYSKKMLSELIELARSELGARQLSLRVYAHNQAELRCYQGLGFRLYGEAEQVSSASGDTWQLLQMRRSLD